MDNSNKKLRKSRVKSPAEVILPSNILHKTCAELYKAGMNVYQIAQQLSLDPNAVRTMLNLSEDESYPVNPIDQALCDRILYDANEPVATEVVIASEKDRFAQYSAVESRCLEIMQKLLNYYTQQPEGDTKLDAFKANLAATFIKATQQCRTELLQKYAVDAMAEAKSAPKVSVEFVN